MAKIHLPYVREKGILGPFSFDLDEIEDIPEDMYGVYLLTHEDDDGIVVMYVGRGDLRDRLSKHTENKEALHFFFKPLGDEVKGFKEECRLFHRYGKRRHLLNRYHPAVPAGAPNNFPKCSERGCRGEAD